MNRRRRTREQLDTLDEQLVEVLRADRPQCFQKGAGAGEPRGRSEAFLTLNASVFWGSFPRLKRE